MKKAMLLVAGAAVVTVLVAGCSWCGGDKKACPADAKTCAAGCTAGCAAAPAAAAPAK